MKSKYTLKGFIPSERCNEVMVKLLELSECSSFTIVKVEPQLSDNNYIFYANINAEEYNGIAYRLMQLWISFELTDLHKEKNL